MVHGWNGEGALLDDAFFFTTTLFLPLFVSFVAHDFSDTSTSGGWLPGSFHRQIKALELGLDCRLIGRLVSNPTHPTPLPTTLPNKHVCEVSEFCAGFA